MLMTLLIGFLTALPEIAFATGRAACPLDCDNNGRVSPNEHTYLPRALFAPEQGCTAADVNLDATLSAADLTRLRIVLAAMDDSCLTPESEWVALSPLAAGARQEIGVAELDGVIYAIGGFEAPFAGQSNRVEAYDIATNTWRIVAALPLVAHHIGTGVAGGDLFVVGGLTTLQFNPRSEVFRYVPEQDAWEARAPLPTARGALAVATLGNRLHAIAGFGAGRAVADHASYDPTTDRWNELAPLPDARDHLAAATLDGRLYVVGGRNPNSARLDRYDPSTDSWESLAPMPTARSGHAAAAIDGRLVVIGGEVDDRNPPNRVFDEVELYEPETDRWVSLPPMPVPRHGMGAVTAGGAVYVPGGAFRAGFGASARNDLLLLRW